MDVKAGYQLTEVGVIPEDWNNMKLNNLITHCFSGATPRRNQPDFYKGDIRWITSGELNYNVIMDTAEKITSEAVEATNLTIVPAGTFLMAITGLEAEGTRGACGIVGAPSTTNQSCMAVFPNSKLLTSYLFHYYVFRGKSLALQYCQGTKQQSYTAKLVKQLPIAIPSTTAEQRAIAEALSDMDALLDGLDRLIAKKRDLKQAAMQQLLTGQTRLPGFSGAWEVKTFGELFSFSGGHSASRDQLSTEGHCYLHYGDIHGAKKTYIDTHVDFHDIPKLNIPINRVSATSLLKDGDVVFVDASEDDEGTSKHIVVVNKENIPFISGLHTIVAKSKTGELAHEYRQFCFQTFAIRKQFLFYAVGTKVSGISKTNIAKLKISIPSLPEQTAIAEVLTAMDDELAALAQRREKTRHLKQAMMQTLLSGQTRLIPRKETTT